MGALTAIIVFSILIAVHEFGHFLAAKKAGVKVEQFALGFGPALFKKKGKETTFMICLFPLGGFVKMAGDERNNCKGSDFEFLSKPIGVRMRIVFAGPVFNYFLAFFLFSLCAFFGFASSKPIVGSLVKDFPAQLAGVEVGDKIISVDSQEITNWKQMQEAVHSSSDRVKLTIERGEEIVVLNSDLKIQEGIDDFGRKKEVAFIGITPEIVKYSLGGALIDGSEVLFAHTVRFFKGIYAITTGIVPFKKAAVGPLGIYFITAKAAQLGILAVFNFMAIISLSLGLINLFPIPVLDGGHILLLVIGKIRKKEVSQKTEELLTKVGMALLATLIVFVLYSDIKRGPNFFKEDTTEKTEEIEE